MRTTSTECAATLDGQPVAIEGHPMLPNAWIARPGFGMFRLVYKNIDPQKRPVTLGIRLDTADDPAGPRTVPPGGETVITMTLNTESQVIGIDRTYEGEQTVNLCLILNP